MNSIKAVIFDMDGVILDSESISDITWHKALEEAGLKDDKDAVNKCRGTNLADTYAILKELYGKDFPVEKFMNRSSELFTQIEFTSGIPLLPYAKEILEYLKPKYRIVLASSTKGATVKRQLTNAGVIQYFETITTGDMVTHSKPDPEIYLLACKSLGLKPEECAAIEDSPNGIKSASAAGLKTIMVPDKIQPTEELMPLIWKVCYGLKEVENVL